MSMQSWPQNHQVQGQPLVPQAQGPSVLKSPHLATSVSCLPTPPGSWQVQEGWRETRSPRVAQCLQRVMCGETLVWNPGEEQGRGPWGDGVENGKQRAGGSGGLSA